MYRGHRGMYTRGHKGFFGLKPVHYKFQKIRPSQQYGPPRQPSPAYGAPAISDTSVENVNEQYHRDNSNTANSHQNSPNQQHHHGNTGSHGNQHQNTDNANNYSNQNGGNANGNGVIQHGGSTVAIGHGFKPISVNQAVPQPAVIQNSDSAPVLYGNQQSVGGNQESAGQNNNNKEYQQYSAGVGINNNLRQTQQITPPNSIGTSGWSAIPNSESLPQNVYPTLQNNNGGRSKPTFTASVPENIDNQLSNNGVREQQTTSYNEFSFDRENDNNEQTPNTVYINGPEKDSYLPNSLGVTENPTQNSWSGNSGSPLSYPSSSFSVSNIGQEYPDIPLNGRVQNNNPITPSSGSAEFISQQNYNEVASDGATSSLYNSRLPDSTSFPQINNELLESSTSAPGFTQNQVPQFGEPYSGGSSVIGVSTNYLDGGISTLPDSSGNFPNVGDSFQDSYQRDGVGSLDNGGNFQENVATYQENGSSFQDNGGGYQENVANFQENRDSYQENEFSGTFQDNRGSYQENEFSGTFQDNSFSDSSTESQFRKYSVQSTQAPYLGNANYLTNGEQERRQQQDYNLAATVNGVTFQANSDNQQEDTYDNFSIDNQIKIEPSIPDYRNYDSLTRKNENGIVRLPTRIFRNPQQVLVDLAETTNRLR